MHSLEQCLELSNYTVSIISHDIEDNKNYVEMTVIVTMNKLYKD